MTKYVSVAFLIALLFTSAINTMYAQDQQTTASVPLTPEAQILKTIVFITVEIKRPSRPSAQVEPPKLYGTGFLVSVPDQRLKNAVFTYIVTNRHVAEAIEVDQHGNCVPLPIGKIYATMNLQQRVNGKRLDPVNITPSQDRHWYFPVDEASDLAVMPFGIDSKYDFKTINLDQFLTTEILNKQQVVPGYKVLTGGFFYGYAGLHEIQPILREGVLAMMPDGPMATTTCKSGDVYLADVHVIPGNSGSPIFVIPALPMGSGVSFGGPQNTFGLLGVVSGYMQETQNLTLKASTTWKGSVQANSGIAVVVPAQQLKDLLNSPEIQHTRDEEINRRTGQ